MELWAVLSIAAAFLQNLRSAVQSTLTGRAGVTAATFARFVYALPWALALVAALVDRRMPAPGPSPASRPGRSSARWRRSPRPSCCSTSSRLRNFAVGNTYAKTETVQTAIYGARAARRPGRRARMDRDRGQSRRRPAPVGAGRGARSARPGDGVGLAAGAAFAIASIGYRGAALALTGEAGFLVRAAFTLAAVLTIQTAGDGGLDGAARARGDPRDLRRMAARGARRGRRRGRLARLVLRADAADRGAGPRRRAGRADLQLGDRASRLPRAAEPARDARDRAGGRRHSCCWC